jgi:multidrug efflux pump subunit AcrA (membrane-fusion protein)
MKRVIAAVLLMMAVVALGACQQPQAEPSPPEPKITVTHPDRGAVTLTITLPGDLVGFYQAALYSKVTGYLKSILVDKGDRVKAGQLLAVIEVPELDQQLSRAKAQLEIERLTYERLQSVWKSDPRLVARQDVDIANGKYEEAKASADELLALDGYTRITAPFDGVVTERFVDPGALVHAGGQQSVSAPMQGPARPGGSAAPVVSIARLDKLRIYIYVPQDEVDTIYRGMSATISVQGMPGTRYTGTVARFAHSLDLSTRTMLTEVDLENPRWTLYPGMYANVTLLLQNHQDALRVPSTALEGNQVHKVMLVRDGRIAEVPVKTGISNAHFTEILSGISTQDSVADTFDSSLQTGQAVESILAPQSRLASLGVSQ